MSSMVVVAKLSYAAHRSSSVGMVAAVALCLVAAPLLVIDQISLSSIMVRFQLSIFAIQGFRLAELVCGTGPRGFDKSAKNWTVYFVAQGEVLFDKEGDIQKAPRGMIYDLVLQLLCKSLLLFSLLSLGRAADFSPWLTSGLDPVGLPLLGFPFSLPAVWLQAACVYAMLATNFTAQRFLLALLGFDSLEMMRNPLLKSTSVRDFWGRRWNLLIHRLMKRIFFTPFASGSKVSRHGGALLAFAASGMFHEYMWLCVNWGNSYWPGGPCAFFLVQFVLGACESMLSQTSLGTAMSALPAVAKTVFTTLVILPFGPAFLSGIRPLFFDCAGVFPTLGTSPHHRAFVALATASPLSSLPVFVQVLAAACVFLALLALMRKDSISEADALQTSTTDSRSVERLKGA
eukprot:TRINITY_DN6504_c0_g1_i1.p1 TRINITY_DN6504_c0_g1~~TRINITY_DN6504_c0_g1_i1.p1  ORF type:complete len:470 (-),score=83.23 TRINITY_DN6504_c0_g1_i1:38-1243(-)